MNASFFGARGSIAAGKQIDGYVSHNAYGPVRCPTSPKERNQRLSVPKEAAVLKRLSQMTTLHESFALGGPGIDFCRET